MTVGCTGDGAEGKARVAKRRRDRKAKDEERFLAALDPAEPCGMQEAQMTGVGVGGESDGLVGLKWEWFLGGEWLRFHRRRIASAIPDCGSAKMWYSGD
jgi:hypothetical protein